MKLADEASHKISGWLGSVPYFVIFTAVCVVWILWGSVLALTLGLSIQAIYAMIFIQRSTNRLNETMLALLREIRKDSKEDKHATRRVERKIDGKQ